MTKLKNKSSEQTSIFDWLKSLDDRARQAVHSNGSLDVDKQLKASLTQDIKHAHDERGRELSRAEVAARMTDLTGDEITLSQLNNWTAPSHKHGIPAKYLPAFAVATGQSGSYEMLSRHAGLFTLPGEEALRSEIQRYEEKEKEIKHEKRRRLALLEEIKGGK